jgi:hypothetical protein
MNNAKISEMVLDLPFARHGSQHIVKDHKATMGP